MFEFRSNARKFYGRRCTYSSLSPDHDHLPFKVPNFSYQPPLNMQAITYLGKGASVLLLTTLAFSNRSWPNPAQVRTTLAHLRENGEELGIFIEYQLALIPPGDQAADQTRLISSASESSSDLSLKLHFIATALLNLNLSSRSGLANPSVR